MGILDWLWKKPKEPEWKTLFERQLSLEVEGYNAAESGESRSSCPYHRSPEWDWWMRGYDSYP